MAPLLHGSIASRLALCTVISGAVMSARVGRASRAPLAGLPLATVVSSATISHLLLFAVRGEGERGRHTDRKGDEGARAHPAIGFPSALSNGFEAARRASAFLLPLIKTAASPGVSRAHMAADKRSLEGTATVWRAGAGPLRRRPSLSLALYQRQPGPAASAAPRRPPQMLTCALVASPPQRRRRGGRAKRPPLRGNAGATRRPRLSAQAPEGQNLMKKENKAESRIICTEQVFTLFPRGTTWMLRGCTDG